MHTEALPESGKKIFPRLRRCGEDFYLAGGTALALQIGHRVSVDFDLFSEKKIAEELLSVVKKVFPGSALSVSVNNPDELTLFVDEVKVTFLSYPFPVLLDFVMHEEMPFLSVKELAATKAYTIGRRGSYKDYVDLFFVLKEGEISLEEIVELAKKKYGNEFNGRLFLEQIVYMEDITDTEILFLKEKVDKATISVFFTDAVKKIRL